MEKHPIMEQLKTIAPDELYVYKPNNQHNSPNDSARAERYVQDFVKQIVKQMAQESGDQTQYYNGSLRGYDTSSYSKENESDRREDLTKVVPTPNVAPATPPPTHNVAPATPPRRTKVVPTPNVAPATPPRRTKVVPTPNVAPATPPRRTKVVPTPNVAPATPHRRTKVVPTPNVAPATPPPTPNAAPATPPPTPNAAPATPPDLIEELRNHGLDFDFSDEYKEVLQSSKYAELLAKLKTSKFPFSEKRVEAIKEARQEMEDLRKEQHNILRSKLEKFGVSNKSINGILEMQDITFLTAIYRQITDNELKLTSSDQKNILQESATRFTNWWTRQGGGGDKYLSSSRMVGNVKKAAFMGALAVPAILVGTVAGHETGKALFVGGLAATTGLASNQNQFSASSPAKVRVKGADGTETVKNEIDVKGDDTIIEKVPLAKVQGDYRLEKDIALIRDAYRQASDKVIFKGPAYVVTDVQEKNRSKDVARARNRLKYSLGSFAGGLILSSEFIHHI